MTAPAPPSIPFFIPRAFIVGVAEPTTIGFLNFTPAISTERSTFINLLLYRCVIYCFFGFLPSVLHSRAVWIC